MRSEAGLRIEKSLKDALAYAKGELPEGSYRVHPGSVDVKAIRTGLGMTQEAFAARFGFSVNTLRHWERGNREPEGPTRAYLFVICRAPDAVKEALMSDSGLRKPKPRHPGDFIRTQLIEPRKLSVTDVAKHLCVSRHRLSALLGARASLSGEMALRLEKVFKLKADTLMRMQSSWDIARARQQADAIKVHPYQPDHVSA